MNLIISLACAEWASIPVSLSVSRTYEEILDISLFFTLILTFSCCSLSMANTGDEVIYLHYFDFVNFYKKKCRLNSDCTCYLLQDDTICFKMIL